LIGAGAALLRAGWVFDGCGATDVGGAGAVDELSGNTSTKIGTATTAAAAATSAILACLA
jgi:hypothetical protein